MEHLAQINIALMKHDPAAEEVKDFFDQIDAINRLAEEHHGYVWRYQDGEDIGDEIAYFDYADHEPRVHALLINMSVWTDIDALKAYVYQSGHIEVFRRRAEWFHPSVRPHMAMWHIEPGRIPTLAEARERLAHLERHGPSPYAFDFRKLRT